jgi:predicted glycosyltransferase
MRVWIDLTNSPHVLVMRPVIEVLRADGHEVRVTARDFAQTLQLLERFGIEHVPIGHHRGGRVRAKALGLAERSAALVRWARRDARTAGARFDIALGHGSNDVGVAACVLRIPCSTMFDYEWAAVQHHVNCRLCQAVVVPDAIPPGRLARYGAGGKIRAYEGLKEEYYLADFEPDERVLAELGLDRERPIAVVRTPPAVSLYHRFENDLFADVLARLREAARRGSVGNRDVQGSDMQGEGVQGEGVQGEGVQGEGVQGEGVQGEGVQGGDVQGSDMRGSDMRGSDMQGEGVQSVVLPRTDEQRKQLREVPGFVVPERAIDAQSLIACADLVISAGGTMNREAVALGTPVYTTFEGRLGAVDERLIAEGRLRKLAAADELDLTKRDRAAGEGVQERVRRDPRRLVELLLSPTQNAVNSS